MAITKKHINSLKSELEKIEVAKYKTEKLNEDNTRKRIIEPMLMSLGYSWDNMESEYGASRKGNERADIGLKTLNNKTEILVECKRLGEKLLKSDLFTQLNQYFESLPTTRIGVLTDGVIWNFYAPKDENSRYLNYEPYYTFNLEDYTEADLEVLLSYSRNEFQYKKTYELAFEKYFNDAFENALVDELFEPSDAFLKAIHLRMGGKQMKERMRETLTSLINSKTIQRALDKVIQKEIKVGGVTITTAEELNIYHVVKTILVQVKELKKHAERISYRDQKSSFNVIIDDNIRKTICKIFVDGNKKSIEISNKNYPINEISSIVDLKAELSKVAIGLFGV
jgi:hypothetical protein